MIPILERIDVENVWKGFNRKTEVGSRNNILGRRDVLQNVSFSVAEGEIACILGRNGSGKTTLTRIISTLITPDRGRVMVYGFDTIRESPQVRRRIGVMLNAGDGGFYPRISGQTNLEYYAALYQVRMVAARKRIHVLLRELGLEDRGMDQYQSYSSGMRRRLALARALIPDPTVLLLDEPTLGIDPWSTREIHSYLLEKARTGTTILCTTNSATEASSLTKRIFALNKGILDDLRTEDVLVS